MCVTLDHVRRDAAERPEFDGDATDDLRTAVDDLCPRGDRAHRYADHPALWVAHGCVEINGPAECQSADDALTVSQHAALVVDSTSDRLEPVDVPCEVVFVLVKRARYASAGSA